MLIERTSFSDRDRVASVLEENVFRYCKLEHFSFDGGHIDSSFLECEFSRLDWYAGVFNCALFVRGKFRDCDFHGVTFADCVFVECEFLKCRFLENNMAGPCAAPGSRTYACSYIGCEGAEVLSNVVVL